MKSVEVIVATHKKYEMPKSDIYLPLQVGAALNDEIGYKKDNEGKNISDKNPFFCELTGLYWIWKNSNADYKGLVHYRRHFLFRKKSDNKIETTLNTAEMHDLMKKYDLILPKKRNYYIETLYNHYAHTLHVEPLDKTRDVIEKFYPEYLPEFDNLKIRKSAHMFNMMIAKSEIIDEYCEWLFDILFKLEKNLNKNCKEYSAFHSRFYGRISELLLDVWLYTKYPELKENLETADIKVKELKVIDIEGVNWFKKGFSFLKAKFTGKKYEKSF